MLPFARSCPGSAGGEGVQLKREEAARQSLSKRPTHRFPLQREVVATRHEVDDEVAENDKEHRQMRVHTERYRDRIQDPQLGARLVQRTEEQPAREYRQKSRRFSRALWLNQIVR